MSHGEEREFMYIILKQQEYFSLAKINIYPVRELEYVEGGVAKPRL
jgi:hypothetical protein